MAGKEHVKSSSMFNKGGKEWWRERMEKIRDETDFCAAINEKKLNSKSKLFKRQRIQHIVRTVSTWRKTFPVQFVLHDIAQYRINSVTQNKFVA